MGTISEKLTYLNGTKQAIKNAINEDREIITAETTFREYAELIDQMKAYYKSLIPQVTKTGTNSITADKSANFNAMNYNIKGNTEQKSTKGKQLLQGTTNWSGESWTGLNVWEEVQEKYNGLSVRKNKDAFRGLVQTYTVESGKTYTFSVYIKADASKPMVITISGGTSGSSLDLYKTAQTTWTRYNLTFTATANGTVRPRVENTTDSDSNYLYICGYMLEEGSTASDYEEYTGGQPSPSPDYPQDIVAVGDKCKQLFKRNEAMEDNILIWASGLPMAENGSLVSDFIPITKNINLSSNYNFFIFYYNSSKNYLGNSEDLRTTNGLPYTTTLVPNNENIAYCRIVFRKSIGTNPADMTIVTDIMVNEGNSVLPYTEYYEGFKCSIKNKGINYLNLEDWRTSNIEVTQSGTQTTILTPAGTGRINRSKNITSLVNEHVGEIIKFTYKSKDVSHFTSDNNVICQLSYKLNVDSSYHYIPLLNSTENEYSWTILDNIEDCSINFYGNNSNTVLTEDNIVIFDELMLQIGTNETNYEPYRETDHYSILLDRPLYKIGTVADELDYLTKKRKNNIGETILTGASTEDITNHVRDTSVTTPSFRIRLTGVKSSGNTINILSNYYKGVNFNNYYYSNAFGEIATNTTANDLFFMSAPNADTLTNAQFRTWLSTHNTKVVYQLATPTEETIDMPDILLHEGTNIISIDTELAPSEFSVTYYKDWRLE